MTLEEEHAEREAKREATERKAQRATKRAQREAKHKAYEQYIMKNYGNQPQVYLRLIAIIYEKLWKIILNDVLEVN